MTLIQEAERAEKIRNMFIVFSGPCAHSHSALQEINKSVSELSSLGFVLREIEKLLELDTGAGLALIEKDLKIVHEDVAWTLADIWRTLGRLGRERTPEDYQDTWKELTDQSWKNDGKALHKILEGYRRFLESLNRTLDTHVITPTVPELGPDIRRIHDRRTGRTLDPSAPIVQSRQRSSGAPRRRSLTRNNSLKVTSPTSPKLQKSYERERPMSPDDSQSSVGSASDTTRVRQKTWLHSPPLSPVATMSSISQVSSTTPSLDTGVNDHWAQYVFQGVPSSTPFKWSTEETRYHEVEGTKEQSYPDQSYEAVLDLHYPGVRVLLYCRPTDYRSKMVVLYRDKYGKQDYGCLPLEDLHLRREGNVLRICRTKKSSGKPIHWVTMKFPTIERMVLFAGTFIAMRSQDSSIRVPPTIHDVELRDEVSEFGGSIVDSRFHHGLRIWRDNTTNAIRLQASVLKGELDRTPVWCSFITDDIHNEDWCRLVDKRTVALAGLKLHIFSARYKPELGPNGAFMLRFDTRDDAESFVDVIEHLRRETVGGY